jgi:hypothetical protein
VPGLDVASGARAIEPVRTSAARVEMVVRRAAQVNNCVGCPRLNDHGFPKGNGRAVVSTSVSPFGSWPGFGILDAVCGGSVMLPAPGCLGLLPENSTVEAVRPRLRKTDCRLMGISTNEGVIWYPNKVEGQA